MSFAFHDAATTLSQVIAATTDIREQLTYKYLYLTDKSHYCFYDRKCCI